MGNKIVISLLSVFVFVIFILISFKTPSSWLSRLDAASIILGYIVATISLAVATVAYFKRKDLSKIFRKWFRRAQFENVGKPFEVSEEIVTAVIIPVSRQEQPEWILRHLKPKFASLIYSDMSKQTAMDLVEQFSKSPFNVQFFPERNEIKDEMFLISNPDKADETRVIVKHYIERYLEKGIASDQIFVDTTGGKVPWSIGAFQAAEEENVSSIYIIGTQDGWIIDPKIRHHGDPVFMSDHTE